MPRWEMAAARFSLPPLPVVLAIGFLPSGLLPGSCNERVWRVERATERLLSCSFVFTRSIY